jgi:hypothetical protein
LNFRLAVALEAGFDCETAHGVEMHGFEGLEMEGLVESDVGSATDKEASRLLEVDDTLML